MSQPAIVLEGLSRRFGKKLAVDGLSFQVEVGRVCGFLGRNGAGDRRLLRPMGPRKSCVASRKIRHRSGAAGEAPGRVEPGALLPNRFLFRRRLEPGGKRLGPQFFAFGYAREE